VDGSIVPHKWDPAGFPVTWQMNPVQGTYVTGVRQQSDALTASFAAWAAVVPVSVKQGVNTDPTVKASQYDGINVITSNTSATDLPTGVLAYTFTFIVNQAGLPQSDMYHTGSFVGQIVEADMEFANNQSYPYNLDAAGAANKFDFQSVATHEAGHFFGMDHASDSSSTMFWTTGTGYTYQRNLSQDDIAGISTLYPPPTFSSTGTLSGKVRTTTNTAVYGAIVVAVNSTGQPVASTVTDPSGAYVIQGLPAGTYTVFAEPLSGRISAGNIGSLQIYSPATVNTNFTVRYH
jgi:hypothetical protein